jgi:hypothetical protein
MEYGAKSYACFTEGISIYDWKKSTSPPTYGGRNTSPPNL